MSATPNPPLSLGGVPLSKWVFIGHCNSTGPFIQESLENPNGPTIAATVNFLRDSLPAEVEVTNIPPIDLDIALLRWYRERSPLPQQSLDLATESCKTKICPLLEWPGEPDACGVGIMAAQYIQMGVTTIHVFLFLAGRFRYLIHYLDEAAFPRPWLAWISTSIKACIRMNVEFARALSLGLCVAVIIASYDDRYSSHSISAGAFAASAFSMSFLLLEFISWEWCCCDARYAVVPVLFLVPFLTLVGIVNDQKDVRMGNSSQFYRFCFDFGRVNALADKMHYIVLGHAVLIVGFFVAWLCKRVSRWRSDGNEEADGVETLFQICIVVLTTSAQGVLVYSFVAYQKMVASVVGERDPESQWTLGQILSLTAWIPVVVEFVAIISSGDGLQMTWGWRLLKGWKLREEKRQDDERELEALHPRATADTPTPCAESQRAPTPLSTPRT